MIEEVQKKNATRFILLTVFAYSMGFGIIMPVLPELIVELEGVSLSEATLIGGFIAAAYAVFQFLMGPLVGNLGDRFGRRPVFLLSLAGFSVDFFLMGFAPNILWLFIGRSVAGALGAIFGPANAAMADMSSGEDRAKGFGMVGAAFGIGFIFGPALGGFLGDYGTRLPFFVAGGLAAIVFVYGWFAFPETMPVERRREFSWKRANPVGALLSVKKLPGVLGIAIIYLIWVTATNIYPVSWAYFAPVKFGWSTKMVGLSLGLVGVSMALVQMLLLGKVVSRYGERITAMIGISAAVSAMLFYVFGSSGTTALIICLFIGVQGMVMPSINAMMSRRTPEDQQGELQGFNGSLAALAALISPLIYNTSLSYYTSPEAPVFFVGAPFVLSATLGTIALVSLFFLKPAPLIAEVKPLSLK
jgi:DHA1 family tetracycline resistance protein-like MFS transporter